MDIVLIVGIADANEQMDADIEVDELALRLAGGCPEPEELQPAVALPLSSGYQMYVGETNLSLETVKKEIAAKHWHDPEQVQLLVRESREKRFDMYCFLPNLQTGTLHRVG